MVIGIEPLRFISAFAVLIWHYQHFAQAGQGVALERDAQPFYFLLAPFYEHGLVGVQVFWCISGFIFYFRYFEEVSRKRISFGTYALHRFSRLYPLHFVTLMIVALLQPIYEATNGNFFVYQFNDLEHFTLNLFFANYWGLQDGYNFNGPIWSVSVEIIVYALFFVLVRLPRLAITYGGAIVLFFLLQAAGQITTAKCLMYFFAGGIIALIRFHPQCVCGNRKVAAKLFPASGVVLVVASAVLFYTAGYQLPGVMVLVYLFVAANSGFVASAPLWRFLGNLTYSSYLVHFPIQLVFVLLIPVLGLEVDYRNPWLLVAFLVTTLVLSALTFQHLEAPVQKAIRRRYGLA